MCTQSFEFGRIYPWELKVISSEKLVVHTAVMQFLPSSSTDSPPRKPDHSLRWWYGSTSKAKSSVTKTPLGWVYPREGLGRVESRLWKDKPKKIWNNQHGNLRKKKKRRQSIASRLRIPTDKYSTPSFLLKANLPSGSSSSSSSGSDGMSTCKQRTLTIHSIWLVSIQLFILKDSCLAPRKVAWASSSSFHCITLKDQSLGTLRFTRASCYYRDFDRVGLGWLQRISLQTQMIKISC